MRRKWSALAGLDHVRNQLRFALQHRFNRPVAAIAHPTVKAACTRLIFDKSTIADALHTPMHQQVTDDNHTRTPIPRVGRSQRCRLRT